MLKPHIPKDITKRSMVPIIVGVTGHRFIKRRHEPVIKHIFRELDKKYPNTPIVVLSPLADGADRLVAKVALDMKRRRSTSLSLICPLPMPREEYERDFDDESKKEFADLLARATAWFEMPLAIGSTLENIKDWDKTPRKTQYLEVGRYIARHSHILLALWDGGEWERTKIEKLGGTSQIVTERHEGILRTARSPLDENDSGPIYHFLTYEVENGDAEIKNIREIFPGMDLADPVFSEDFQRKRKAFHLLLKRIEMFNIDARRTRRNWKDWIDKNRRYVIPDESVGALTSFSQRLLYHYSVADTLAIYYQKLFVLTLQALFGIALLALALFEFYAHMFPGLPFILLGYPLVLGCAWLLFKTAKSNFLQSKYLDYRALAEGLRVQFFWLLSGQNIEVLDYYLPKHKSELDWIKHAIHALNMPFSAKELKEKRSVATVPGADLLGNLETKVLRHWVKDQADYFDRGGPRDKNKLDRYHLYGKILIGSGIGVSLFLVLAQVATQGHSQTGDHHGGFFPLFQHSSIIFIAMAIALAAAFGGYAEKAALSAQANRYFSMSRIFQRAQAKLEGLLKGAEPVNLSKFSLERQEQLKLDQRAREIREAQDLVFELGKAALEENADWLIIRRERELEVPAG